jgi:fluoride exporter
MQKITLLFLAGGIGCLARYGLAGFVQRVYGGELPLGTLIVNLLGCLMFGFVWTLAEDRLVINGETRLIILTGFMGSFTTFSTFAFESNALMRNSEWLYLSGNLVLHVVVGILAINLGMALARFATTTAFS